MENFGAVLKDIRISKNFRLKDLACNEISESTISRFENGVTKLSINHFYILLDRLGTSFSEFEELVHCYYSQKVCFWGELENAVNSSDIFLLQELVQKIELRQKQEKSLCNYHIKLITEQQINRLANLPYNSSKCNELIKYLLSVDTWMEYELKIFYNSVFFMNTKTISLLYRIVIKKTRHFLKTETGARRVIPLYLFNLELLLKNNLLDSAQFFIDDLENLLTRQGYYFEKNYLLFLRGVYHIKTNRVEIGKKECSKAMRIFKEYNDSDTIEKLNEIFRSDFIF
ncbi:helix-turn-helix domain-containing protein [Streptococcus oralis]|jgi:transcriptional activator, rgg/gadR/mutR family, C-terminal domain|uniref:XRE family transcriptional regulator n=2 Tax=Streptococcus oralis TaxID=1303 RepID=A0A1X1GAR2_STROR|nr:Rgg/GadR/MutR family transcriptional regulator [Streptococcus oralis]MDU6558424.1 helix-turn-helix domain-containing protein [Streptococcus sp.]EJP23489.1 DNA-binding helix-turn-helix protein [Streptococcus oralis SK304]MCY7072509.1 helix-turn-helix domain-containing protein [Streptococcus oralis]MCY7100179.1 helix-turn-helix domain-containing protein [Streptococcus oralis]ORO43940.1 XRE family transcriptional regulator [Streptococcus oralis subsp. tigurinus]